MKGLSFALSFITTVVAQSSSWSCQLQTIGQNGIGLYQDDLFNSGKNAVLWDVLYSDTAGATFFSSLSSVLNFTIRVGTGGTYSEIAPTPAPSGSSWQVTIDQGLIGTPTKTGNTCSWQGKPCISVSVSTTKGFGYPVYVLLKKNDNIMSNYSVPFPDTAYFQLDSDTLYYVPFMYETKPGVPITQNMRQNAYRVDLSAHCYDKQPIVVKVLSISTSPYIAYERPILDPYGSRCLSSSPSPCISITFNGTWYSPMSVAVFVKDRKWEQSRTESYRPIVWQKLRTDIVAVNYTFPYDNSLSVGSIVFTTTPIDYANYILTAPIPAQLGTRYTVSLDASGLPVLAPGISTGDKTIQIQTPAGWRPKYSNTYLAVFKNNVPLAYFPPLVSTVWIFDLDLSYVYFKGDNQFDLYGKVQDFDIDNSNGFTPFTHTVNRNFMGIRVTNTNTMEEFTSVQQCATAYCGVHGVCNNSTGACDCAVGWKGMLCQYPLQSCVGVDCGVHGYCSVVGLSWVCNCVDQWSGSQCQTSPLAPTQPTPKPTLSPTLSPTTQRPTTPSSPSSPSSPVSPTSPTLPPQPTQPTLPTSRPTRFPTSEPGCVIPVNPAPPAVTTAATVVVAGSMALLVVPHWGLFLLWNQLQTLSLTQQIDNFPDRYRAYMSTIAVLNFQGWGWLNEGDSKGELEIKPEYPCVPGCGCVVTSDKDSINDSSSNNSSSVDVPWRAVDQLPPTALHVGVALAAAFLLGSLIFLFIWLFAKCTVTGYELQQKHKKILHLLPFSFTFRVFSLAYLSLNYSVYQHLVWFRGESSVWTSVAWGLLTCTVGLLGAYIFIPHKHHPSYEFALASIYLDARTNSKLRSLEKLTFRQKSALLWPFVGLFHNHLFGIVVAILQPDRASVSFVSTVEHATDSVTAMSILVALSFLQIVIFVILRPYSSRFKTRITFFSLFYCCLCLCLLLFYTLQRGTTPEIAPMAVMVLNTVGALISFVLLSWQSIRELVGDEALRGKCPWFFRKTRVHDPLLDQPSE